MRNFLALATLAVVIVGIRPQALAEPRGDAPQTAHDLWMSGFLKYKEAVVAERGNNAALALRMYQEAANIFTRVQTEHPRWQPSVISFRLAECKNRIRVLNTQLAERQTELSREELLTLNQTLKAQFDDLEEKAISAMERVEVLSAQLENATLPAEDLTALRERANALEEENRALLQNATDDDGRANKKLKARITELEAENTNLRGALQKAADETAKATKMAGEIESLKGMGKALEESLAKTTREKTNLHQQLATAVAERRQVGEELQKLSKKLETLQATSDNLRRQNEALRKQL